MAKTARAKLKDKADRLAREVSRLREGCQAAGLDNLACNGSLQWAHIVGRGNHRLRWEVHYNSLQLCAGHHMHYTYNPWNWQEFIRDNFPEQYEYVNKHRNEPWDKDLEAVITKLEEELHG